MEESAWNVGSLAVRLLSLFLQPSLLPHSGKSCMYSSCLFSHSAALDTSFMTTKIQCWSDLSQEPIILGVGELLQVKFTERDTPGVSHQSSEEKKAGTVPQIRRQLGLRRLCCPFRFSPCYQEDAVSTKTMIPTKFPVYQIVCLETALFIPENGKTGGRGEQTVSIFRLVPIYEPNMGSSDEKRYSKTPPAQPQYLRM